MKRLYTEIADSEHKREKGLMYRKKLSNNCGMLFKFAYGHYLSFWMKNTYIPLDIAFIDDVGKILQIETMKPLATKTTTSHYICKYALETNENWFKNNNIKIGSLVGGEGITHRYGKLIRFAAINPLGQTPLDEPTNLLDGIGGAQQAPNRLYTLPFDENNEDQQSNEDQQPNEGQQPVNESVPNPEVEYSRDMRSKIQYAQDNNKQMEIVYWTLEGNILPPRLLAPVPREGYPIRSGPNGSYLVALDISPTIQGAGWSIQGMQIKSFLLDNIVSLELSN